MNFKSNGEICMFLIIVEKTKEKNIFFTTRQAIS